MYIKILCLQNEGMYLKKELYGKSIFFVLITLILHLYKAMNRVLIMRKYPTLKALCRELVGFICFSDFNKVPVGVFGPELSYSVTFYYQDDPNCLEFMGRHHTVFLYVWVSPK